MHDDIGSTLSGIHMYSHMVGEAAATGLLPQYNRSIDTIKAASGEMIRKLKDMVWTIQPGNFSLNELGEKIHEYLIFMAGAKNIKIIYNNQIEENRQVNTAWRHHVFVIAKEMINNAVKYSEAAVITVTMKSGNGMLTLEVSDNGIGFNPAIILKGNGLNNMQERAAELGSKLIVTTTEGKGTGIQLISKIT